MIARHPTQMKRRKISRKKYRLETRKWIRQLTPDLAIDNYRYLMERPNFNCKNYDRLLYNAADAIRWIRKYHKQIDLWLTFS